MSIGRQWASSVQIGWADLQMLFAHIATLQWQCAAAAQVLPLPACLPPCMLHCPLCCTLSVLAYWHGEECGIQRASLCSWVGQIHYFILQWQLSCCAPQPGCMHVPMPRFRSLCVHVRVHRSEGKTERRLCADRLNWFAVLISSGATQNRGMRSVAALATQSREHLGSIIDLRVASEKARQTWPGRLESVLPLRAVK